MSSRLTRSSRRLEIVVPDAPQPANIAVNAPPLGKLLRASSFAPEAIPKLDPNRRFNPDVLLTIAEMLVDEEEYGSVINLSCVSRLIGASLKPYLERVRQRLILKLDDLNLEETDSWSAIKYIECSRSSPYPILRHLPADIQEAQKATIRRLLKPTVIRYLGVPHECVFRLQKELFPSARIIRCLYDPFAQNLASVFGSTSTKVGETAFQLFHRMVPYTERMYYDDPPRPRSGIKVIEYQKKGFEWRDLDAMPDRQIQSTVQIKASGGFRVYRENWERYDGQAQPLQYLLTNKYLKNIQVVDRPDLKDISIKIYMKPTRTGASASLLTSDNGYTQGLRMIYDRIEDIARTHLSQNDYAKIKFQLFYIHGRASAAAITRPDYSSLEVRRHRSRSWSRHSADIDSEDEDYDSEDDEDDDDDDNDDESPNLQPVYTLEFTRHEGRIRATESSMDKDVLACSALGGCSRCRAEVA